jgi:hypothetical protein
MRSCRARRSRSSASRSTSCVLWCFRGRRRDGMPVQGGCV